MNASVEFTTLNNVDADQLVFNFHVRLFRRQKSLHYPNPKLGFRVRNAADEQFSRGFDESR